MRRVALASAVLLTLAGETEAAEPATLVLDGMVEHPLHLTRVDLEAMPATELDASFVTGKGPETAHYKGVQLWSLVEKAGLGVISKDDARGVLRHGLLVIGRDGYAALVAIGEIDPDLEGKQAIIAYARDGKPLAPDDFRLIVPGDHHGSRAVHEIAEIKLE